MPLLNYTTSIKASKTISQIMDILANAGARQIIIDYGDGIPHLAEALTFVMDIDNKPVPFRLKCRWRAIQHILESDGRVAKRFRKPGHCLNVGWRIIKVWIEAQIALIEADQADIRQLFLPYAVGPDGRMLYEHVLGDNLLGPGDDVVEGVFVAPDEE